MTMATKNRRRPADHRELSGLAQQLAPTVMPRAPLPMLCTLVVEPFNNPAWIFEPKYDGLRVLGRFDGRELTLLSRNQALGPRRLRQPAGRQTCPADRLRRDRGRPIGVRAARQEAPRALRTD